MTVPPPAPDDDSPHPQPSSSRPGLSTFTIEGRAAPGLFVVGWIATVVGGASTLAGVLGNAGVVVVIGLVLLSIGLVAGAGSQAIERRARGGHAYAGPSPLLVFAATIPVTFLAAVPVGFVLDALRVTLPRPGADLLLVSVQALVAVGLVALLVVGTGGLSWREIGIRADPRRALTEFAWGAVLASPIVVVTAIVTALLVALLNATPESPLQPTGETSGLLLHLLAGALVAPIYEEIVFRGVATTAWVRRYGATSGIVRGALVFAFAHVLTLSGTDPREALAAAAIGFAGRLPVALALGWVYVRRRSLWAAIGLHSAFNAILLVLAYVAIGSGVAPA